MRACSDSRMPMPVSRTAKRRAIGPQVAGALDSRDDERHFALIGELDRVADQIDQHLRRAGADRRSTRSGTFAATSQISSSPF